jgi:hypothetical protein
MHGTSLLRTAQPAPAHLAPSSDEMEAILLRTSKTGHQELAEECPQNEGPPPPTPPPASAGSSDGRARPGEGRGRYGGWGERSSPHPPGMSSPPPARRRAKRFDLQAGGAPRSARDAREGKGWGSDGRAASFCSLPGAGRQLIGCEERGPNRTGARDGPRCFRDGGVLRDRDHSSGEGRVLPGAALRAPTPQISYPSPPRARLDPGALGGELLACASRSTPEAEPQGRSAVRGVRG